MNTSCSEAIAKTQEIYAYRKRALVFALAFLALLSAGFYVSVSSMVAIWIRSETYAHCFLILPIALWMIWQRKERVYQSITRPSLWAIVPLLLSGLAWYLAVLVDVLVVQHFALIGMLISGVWMLLGSAASWQMAFPLAYLFFMVPVGEGLVPGMMEYTATFTVKMIELTGIPVYREGLHFVLPTGSWSVVAACSGVRYLIASMALGCLFAYLNYQSPWRRAAFIAASIVVPIIANGIRAYMIVMLGHLSDMEIATGVDHLIYGWIFFGVVMFLLFWVGSFWSEEEGVYDVDRQSIDRQISGFAFQKEGGASAPALNVAAGFCLIALLVWPFLHAVTARGGVTEIEVARLPDLVQNWSKVRGTVNWRPSTDGSDGVAGASYSRADTPVQLVVHQIATQAQGKELVPGRELLVEPKGDWRIISKQTGVTVPVHDLSVNETVLRNINGQLLLVWSWYRVGDYYQHNPYWVKVLEARQKLVFARKDSSRLFVATRVEDLHQGLEIGRERLEDFVLSGLTSIEQALDESAGL